VQRPSGTTITVCLFLPEFCRPELTGKLESIHSIAGRVLQQFTGPGFCPNLNPENYTIAGKNDSAGTQARYYDHSAIVGQKGKALFRSPLK
jgi:hypothetical protein